MNKFLLGTHLLHTWVKRDNCGQNALSQPHMPTCFSKYNVPWITHEYKEMIWGTRVKLATYMYIPWRNLRQYLKSFIAKRVISILVNLRYLRFKLLKYKENNKKICNTFDHNFKNIPLYIMSNVSLERYYFVLYDGALTLKMSKMARNAFCDKTLHLFSKL